MYARGNTAGDDVAGTRRPLPAWTSLVATLLVALAAALSIALLHRYAETNYREATLFAHIEGATFLLQHLEAEAKQPPEAAATGLQGEWLEERAVNLQAAREQLEQALAELARIDADDAREVRLAITRYVGDIDELTRLVATGAETEAEAWDETHVDPSFAVLVNLVDEEANEHAAIAARITRLSGVLEAGVLGVVGIVIGLLFHRFARAGRAVAELAAEQRAMRASEARFSSLIRNALDIITIISADGPVRYTSPAITRVLGYRQEELVGIRAFDLIHPEDQPVVDAAFLTARDDPTLTPTVEFRFHHKDGSWRWLEATGTNLLADPAVSGIVVNARDVTERKVAEGAMRQSELGLAEAQRLARLGSWEWDLRSNRSTWSAGMYHIMEIAPEAFCPSYEEFIERIHPEDRLRVQGIVGEALANQTEFAFECRMLGHAGTELTLYSITTPLFDVEGRFSGLRGTVQDISDRKRLEEELRYQAFHDSLTDLPNRTGFILRLEDALLESCESGRTVAMLFLDLDRFKIVNDSLGHMLGDQVLVAVSERLTALLRDADTLGRFGGDEFAVLLTGDLQPNQAEQVAYRMLVAFDVPFVIDGRELFITGSIGIAFSSSALSGAMDLLQAADVAMYQAKAMVPGGYAVFDPGMNASAVMHLELETDLQRAVEHNELVLHYQPKVDLVTGAIVALEALLRWQHPRLGLLQPGDFLQLAEETGLIEPIGRWALAEACCQAVAWRATLAGFGDCLMCVNLSAREFRQPNLVAQVTRILKETGLPPAALELEITEQVLVDDDQAIASLVRLKEIGIHLALDDFGTGHSALSSLRRLPIETLKIDRSFVQDVMTDPRTRAVVQAVTALAHDLGMQVVAEGVETDAQLESVRNLSIDIVQGAYFARALSAADCLALLTTWTARRS